MCGSTGGLPTPAKDDLHTIAMGVNRETYVSAINGFGRLGRKVAGIAMKDPGVELTLTFASYDPESIVYMMEYDSFHGMFDCTMKASEGGPPSIV